MASLRFLKPERIALYARMTANCDIDRTSSLNDWVDDVQGLCNRSSSLRRNGPTVVGMTQRVRRTSAIRRIRSLNARGARGPTEPSLTSEVAGQTQDVVVGECRLAEFELAAHDERSVREMLQVVKPYQDRPPN